MKGKVFIIRDVAHVWHVISPARSFPAIFTWKSSASRDAERRGCDVTGLLFFPFFDILT